MKKLLPYLYFCVTVAIAAGGALFSEPTGLPAAGLDLGAAIALDGAVPAIALGGLIVNAANLTNLFLGFKTSFQSGLAMAESHWERIATQVPSTTSEEQYGWIGKIPGMREWIGDRVVHGIEVSDYTIKNKHFELTIGVDRDKIEDDNLGIFAPLFQEMGQSTGAHPNIQVFDQLKNGFATTAYDGQFFFDTDHPVVQADGTVASVANTDGGAGEPWFLLATKRALKPIIRQERKAHNFVSLTNENDENVFNRREYVYGVDGRSNVGYGFWQMAWGSKQALSKTTYKLARESIMSFLGDHGRPLGIVPDLLVVNPSNENAALEILNSERDAGGATNVYKGTADLLNTPWLA